MPKTTHEEMLGFEKPETVTIDARRWQGFRRQMIRLIIGWRYADKEAERILSTCRHDERCPAVQDRTRPCGFACPDRETYLSALVIKHNAELYARLQKGLPLRPDGEYTPPSRETYDGVVSELETLREAGDLLNKIDEAIVQGKVPSPWEDPMTIVVSSGDKAVSKLIPAGHEDLGNVEVEIKDKYPADTEYGGLLGDQFPPTDFEDS